MIVRALSLADLHALCPEAAVELDIQISQDKIDGFTLRTSTDSHGDDPPTRFVLECPACLKSPHHLLQCKCWIWAEGAWLLMSERRSSYAI